MRSLYVSPAVFGRGLLCIIFCEVFLGIVRVWGFVVVCAWMSLSCRWMVSGLVVMGLPGSVFRLVQRVIAWLMFVSLLWSFLRCSWWSVCCVLIKGVFCAVWRRLLTFLFSARRVSMVLSRLVCVRARTCFFMVWNACVFLVIRRSAVRLAMLRIVVSQGKVVFASVGGVIVAAPVMGAAIVLACVG